MTHRTLIIVRVLWVAAACALAALWRPEALILLIPLAVVGPLLREVTPRPDTDERQRLVDYRASHIALMVTFLLMFALFARSWFQLGHEPPSELWLVLITPLLVRTAITVAQGHGTRRMALILGFVCGAFWLAFSTLSHGLSPESAVGLSIIGFTVLGLRWPRLGGALLVLVGVAFLALFLVVRGGRMEWPMVVFMTLALPLPPVLAGIALWQSASPTAADDFSDLKEAS
jgi:hypothetical protein